MGLQSMAGVEGLPDLYDLFSGDQKSKHLFCQPERNIC